METEAFLSLLQGYWQSGGPLMYPLVVLIFAIFYLFLVLWHKLKLILNIEFNSYPQQQVLAYSEAQLSYFNAWFIVLAALVCAAPLLGLLGTVMGMIETFQVLGDN